MGGEGQRTPCHLSTPGRTILASAWGTRWLIKALPRPLLSQNPDPQTQVAQSGWLTGHFLSPIPLSFLFLEQLEDCLETWVGKYPVKGVRKALGGGYS